MTADLLENLLDGEQVVAEVDPPSAFSSGSPTHSAPTLSELPYLEMGGDLSEVEQPASRLDEIESGRVELLVRPSVCVLVREDLDPVEVDREQQSSLGRNLGR